jgi:DNA polymerase-1
LWDGDPVLIDRKSDKSRQGEPLYVTDPFLAIIGTIQPSVLHILRGEGPRGQRPPDDGFLDRWLVIYPKEIEARGEEWRDVSDESLEAWSRAIKWLLALPMVAEKDGCYRPFFVPLNGAGRKAWEVFTYAHAAEINSGEVPSHLLGPWSKLKGYCGRLALILSYLGRACRASLQETTRDIGEEVDETDVRKAARLIDYFKAHIRKVHGVIEADPRVHDARRLLAWLLRERRTTFKRWEAFSDLKSEARFPTPDCLDRPLALLVDHNVIRPREDSPRPGPGRPPATLYQVNPALWDDPGNPGNPVNRGNGPPRDDGNGAEALNSPDPSPQEPDTGGISPDLQDLQDHSNEVIGHTSQAQCVDGRGYSQDLQDCQDDSGVQNPTEHPSTASVSAQTNGPEFPKPSWEIQEAHAIPANPENPSITPSRAQTYRLVADAQGLADVLAALADAELLGLDCETTGLDPRRDRVRLLCLAVPTIEAGHFAYVVDLDAIDPSPLFPALAARPIVGHNLAFDLQFLGARGFEPGQLADTMLLSQLLDGTRQPKGFHSLAQVAQRELARTLNKDLQASNWSGTLTAEQVCYASEDALVLLPLYHNLRTKIAAAGMANVADVEMRALPAITWLARSGVALDRARWEQLAKQAQQDADSLTQSLNEAAPPRSGCLDGAAWNWASPRQVKDAFGAAGITLTSTGDDALATVEHPLAALLRQYRAKAKLATTYGAQWLKGKYNEGRLYADWKQMGCVTGRMASATPNLQNLPADPDYRQCFFAPEGRVLIKADYSQIELRIAAKVTGDQAMLDAYRTGQDLHTLTARRITGKKEVNSKLRNLAKPVNFGLIYGLSAGSLRTKAKTDYGLDLSTQDAERYHRAFSFAYPGVYSWHQGLKLDSSPYARTLAGRRCVLPEKHFFGTRANYIVQGTGGDGLKLALALLWERRAQCPGAFPVLAIHDEIVIEADADQAEAAASWLKTAMVDAMTPLIAPVPVEVEVTIARTWAGNQLSFIKTMT